MKNKNNLGLLGLLCMMGFGSAVASDLGLSENDSNGLSATSVPRFNEVQQTGTHNSYWVKRDNYIELFASGVQERLLDQLLFEGVRTIEIDIHKDPKRSGSFSVYHTNSTLNSLCTPLAECLKQLQLFQYAMPQHEPMTVIIELKEILSRNFDEQHTPADLDALIEKYLGPWLFRPRDLAANCDDSLSLRTCVKQQGWPTTHALRGKFIVTVLGNWRGGVSKGPFNLYFGHGPSGWVDYATWGGGVLERSAFPMESYWIQFNQGPDTDKADDARVEAARAASVFMQVEGDQVTEVRAQALLNDNLVLRAGGLNDSVEDQTQRRNYGAHIIQTDSPWYRVNTLAPNQVFEPLPSMSAVDPQTLWEPGKRLLIKKTDANQTTAFTYKKIITPGLHVWETLPSTTRPTTNKAYPNSHVPRGKGCLRAAAGLAQADDAISLCRQTYSGNWLIRKPMGEDAVISVAITRNGKTTTQRFYSQNNAAGGPGDYLQLAITQDATGSTCVTAASASEMKQPMPNWLPHAHVCFDSPLSYQGLAASTGDVLFVGTQLVSNNVQQEVSGANLSQLMNLNNQEIRNKRELLNKREQPNNVGYTLLDYSW